MNSQLELVASQSENTLEALEAEEASERGPWELKNLKPMHREVVSLLAQGMKNVEVAAMVGITPEYVSMLLRQPLIKQHLQERCEALGVRMEALFEQSVQVVADVMKSGSNSDKLKAARLQLEATRRIGRVDPTFGTGESNDALLENLAKRLIALQSNIRRGGIYNEDGSPVTDSQL
jgi:hypothetical protein